MAKECSFDIVSKVDMAEVANALNMANKEIEQRFDLKGSGSKLELANEAITASAPDEMKLKNIVDIFQDKLTKRSVPLKALDAGKIEPALGGAVRQTIGIRQGIDRDNGKKIIELIRSTKLKVQPQIQEDQIRVSAKSKDDLQSVIVVIRKADLPLALQFSNFRD